MKIFNPEKAVKVHALLFWFWVLMTIPSIIFWKSSILYVIFISLYAIWITHIGAMQAFLADRRVERDDPNEPNAVVEEEGEEA